MTVSRSNLGVLVGERLEVSAENFDEQLVISVKRNAEFLETESIARGMSVRRSEKEILDATMLLA